jgi:hypothetical protein
MFPTLLQFQLNFAQPAASQLPYGTVTSNPLGVFISILLPLVIFVAGLLVLFFLITAAIDWISSGGEKSGLEKARNKITNAIIGLIILFASFAIFGILQRSFGVQLLNFNNSGSVPQNTTPQQNTVTPQQTTPANNLAPLQGTQPNSKTTPQGSKPNSNKAPTPQSPLNPNNQL